MKRTKRLTLGLAGATAAGAALLSAAFLPAAQAAQQSAPAASTTAPANSGAPASVSPQADLAFQNPGTGPGANDSIYINGMVKAGGKEYGILVQTLDFVGNPGQRQVSLNLTDVTDHWYKSYSAAIPANKYVWSTKGLNISMPGLTWTGNAQHMTISAAAKFGSVKLQLTSTAPALNYASTGQFNLLGVTNYEYALPSLHTTGTLTLAGKTSSLSGESWLDRQWGPLPLSDPSFRWSWMNISLSNGDKVAVWDFLNSTGQNSWATVQHPDGSYEVVSVRPFAEGASRPWTNPADGNTYPTRWNVDIPSLGSHLKVAITGTPAQEASTPTGAGGAYEGTAAVKGIHHGKPVTGTTFVEMAGNWKG